MTREIALTKLNTAGVRPSVTRLEILNYLENTKSHPTVEDIYGSLYEKIPTLSKTTVYNTLSLFEKSKLIKTLTIEEGRTRFDAKTESHAHFICSACGSVTDLEGDVHEVEVPNGYILEKTELFAYGVCGHCV